ncbi:MAG TPA: aspartate kinase [Bacteroidales bacterium]|nr:aspartate kinase [Bacteroidales bacterium]
MEVFKFGGASVKDAASFCNVPRILEHFKERHIVVVISAMGKTTNALEHLVRSYFYKDEEPELEFNKIKKYHFAIIEELFSDKDHPVYADIEQLFNNLKSLLSEPPSSDFDFEYDRIVPYGEMISSKILSHFLNLKGIQNTWFDITRILITDNEFRNAKVNWQKTLANVKTQFSPVIKQNHMAVLQGFIGKSENGHIVTLGREGSDYSAAIIAYCLDAESVTIWKDVAGVLNADPKYFKETQIINKLAYSDAVELAYYGASVIHPKTIKPLENKKIPLFVKSFANPKADGTIIQSTPVKLPLPVNIFKVNQVLISIYPNDFSFIAVENLRDIFSILADNKAAINLMQNTAISFSLVIDYDPEKLEILIENLKKQFKVRYNTGLELLTIRNFDQPTIEKITGGKEILLEQKTRSTAQYVVRTIITEESNN